MSTIIESNGALSSQASSEMLDTIFAESERMERLINNLLDMTRMESGGLILKKEMSFSNFHGSRRFMRR